MVMKRLELPFNLMKMRHYIIYTVEPPITDPLRSGQSSYSRQVVTDWIYIAYISSWNTIEG